jgi:hypothetical protein
LQPARPAFLIHAAWSAMRSRGLAAVGKLWRRQFLKAPQRCSMELRSAE